MLRLLLPATMSVLLSAAPVSAADRATPAGQPGTVYQGERLDPILYGEGIVETMAEAMARQEPPDPTKRVNPKARNGKQGTWAVPSEGATYHPHSGRHYAVNKWGDTRMGITFDMEVDVHGAYFAGQGGEGVWTPAVRVIGYRHGEETARTDWFRSIGEKPAWFEMGLRGVDRIVIESVARLNGGGWYALDDLTYTRRGWTGQPGPATIVVDFEDTTAGQRLTGTGYAGLIWETGTGDFSTDQQIIPAPRQMPGQELTGPAVTPPTAPLMPDLGTPPQHVQNFQGVIRGDAGIWSAPPDTCGAVGPNHYVIVVNMVFAVYEKETGQNVLMTPLSSLLPAGVGDPRIVWDQHSGRWIALDSQFSYGSQRIALAVSLTDDPTGAWFKTSFVPGQGGDAGCWPDYPTLGVDARGIYITSLMVGDCGRTLFVVDKAPLIAPSPSLGTITAFRGLSGWTMQPAHTYGDPGAEYVVSVWGSNTLWLRRVDGPADNPVLVDVGTIDVPTFGYPPDVPSQSSETPLDSVDHRLMNSVYRDGSLWTAHSVAGGAGTMVRWYEIDASTRTLIQTGDVSNGLINYWMPSIMVNARGDAILGFSGCYSGTFADAYYTGRLAGDPPGEVAPPVLYRQGLGPHTIIDSYGRNRWGDYSLCSLDPDDELTMWSIQEYAESEDGPDSRWGTHVVELRWLFDCNGNQVDDFNDIRFGTSPDANSDGIPDECQESRWYVDQTAVGTGLGTDWDNAFTDLATALNAAPGTDVTEIWVAGGLYKPDGGTGNREASFNLPSGVSVYGGFGGYETLLQQRSPSVYTTILSGDLNEDDGSGQYEDNSYHVVRAQDLPETVRLDGFIILGGNANGAGTDSGGGGVRLDASQVELAGCRIDGCRSTGGGSGLYASGGTLTATDCTIVLNTSTWSGAGARLIDAQATFSRCRFLGNSADRDGGGIEAVGSGVDLLLEDCEFTGNSTERRGGALFNFYVGQTVMANCTLFENSSAEEGGGIYNASSAVSTVRNSIAWANSAGLGSGADIQVYDHNGTLDVDYSCIQDLVPAGDHNVGDDPLLAPIGGDDPLTLLPGSPCIDAGSNPDVPSGVTTDLAGEPRFVDDPDTADTGAGTPPIVDMGVYEYQPRPPETVHSVESVLNHGGTELTLHLTSNNIEPRSVGVQKLLVEMTGPVDSVDVAVDCVGPYPGSAATTALGGSWVQIDLSEPLPDGDCCTLTMSGDAVDSFDVRPLAGDLDRNGTVSTSDANLVKPHFGESAVSAGAAIDFDVNGLITTQDFAGIKPLLGQTAPTCP